MAGPPGRGASSRISAIRPRNCGSERLSFSAWAKVLGGGQPAVAPEADGDPVEAEVSGGGLEAGVGGQREQDEDAADQPLRGGLPLAKLFEQGSLPGREVDGRRRRAAHDRCRFGSRG